MQTDNDLDTEDPLLSPLGQELQDLLPNEPQIIEQQWVAVAYQDNWYPGIVREVLEDKRMRGDISSRTSNCRRFKNPNGKDVQIVELQFVISGSCNPHPVSGGRSWEFDQCDSLDHIFQLFKEIYF